MKPKAVEVLREMMHSPFIVVVFIFMLTATVAFTFPMSAIFAVLLGMFTRAAYEETKQSMTEANERLVQKLGVIASRPVTPLRNCGEK